MIRISLFLASLLGLLLAQCPLTPMVPPSCDDCVPLTENNPIVPKSQTRCVRTGETITVSNISISNNGILLVCGTLILNGDINLNSNGSQVIVTTGGSLYVTSNININSNSTIINYGFINIQSNLYLNGSGSLFWNVGPSGVLNVGGDIIVNSSANFINDGTNIQAFSLVMNGNATVCMTNGACFSLTNLTANGNGNVIVGSGTAAINYTGNATLNGQLTNTDNLYICQAPGATVNNPDNFGTQNVVSNCTSGCNVLSVIRLITSVEVEGHQLYVRWLCQGCPTDVTYAVSALTTNGETLFIGLTKNDHLSILVGLLPANTGYIQITVFNNTEQVLLKRMLYYDISGAGQLIVYPTIVENELNVWCDDETAVIELYDSYGRLVQQATGNGTWDLSGLPSGMYFVIGRINGRVLNPVRLLKR